MMKVWETFGLNLDPLWDRVGAPLVISEPNLRDMFETIPKFRKQKILNRGIGIEVEVESAIRPDGGGWARYWTFKEDHSLRNNGLEFISKFGMRVGHAYGHLQNLCLWMNQHRQGHKHLFDFSERTSVHVHLDCRIYSEDQLRALLILYTLFEKPLFAFAGGHRESNVFTVPIRSSNHMVNYSDVPMRDVIGMWHKYCAINLAPLTQFGSVEFRHMEGTSDFERLYSWIMLLTLLCIYVEKEPLENIQKMVMDIKYESQYDKLLREVFCGFSDLLKWLPKEIDESASDAKFFFKDGL